MPDSPVQFLSRDEVLAIHGRLIEVFGGPEGVRDLGLLESALYRPQSGYYQDLISMAAALFESLLINHPFVDGNKRTAITAAALFMQQNGRRLQTTNEALEQFTILVVNERPSLDEIASWFRSYTDPKS